MPRKKSTPDGSESGAVGNTKQDRVLLAEHMVDELVQNMTAYALAKISGLNYLTIQHISRGEAKRISDKVYLPLKTFYDDWKAGKTLPKIEKHKPGRKPAALLAQYARGTGTGASPTPGSMNTAPSFVRSDLPSVPFIRLDAIQVEIERLEKRIGMLKELLELAKGL